MKNPKPGARNATGFFYAIKTGEFLLKAKAKVPHGEWENWVQNSKSNLPFSTPFQARAYMRLAKNKALAHVVNDTESTFNLEDINNKAIANASDEEKEEAKKKGSQWDCILLSVQLH